MGKKILTIILILLIIVFAIIKFSKENIEKQDVETIAKTEEPIEWRANYIWDETNENNSWMCFRKTVDIQEKNLKNIKARIAVDSKYWLYINGEMVIREGGLKRGIKPDSIYYDEVDISKYLVKGQNTIAVLAWYWGGDSYTHVSSKQPGFLFQMKIGKETILTDDTWKVKKHASYLQDELRPNNRLIEYNVMYDASLFDENWYKEGYDDSSWANATILNPAGSEPWGEMIERNIPQFKNGDLKDYENSKKYNDYTTSKDETLELELPYNIQLTPYLKIDAPAGSKITLKTDTYKDVTGDSVMCTYITKEGEQEFESPAWLNGEKVYYNFPKGVKIISLKYRETGYDTEMSGSFKSDDKFLNKLWEQADRTLYVNMRDSYMDCPNRERAQWFGDMNSAMMESMYALDTKGYDLYEKGVKTILGWEIENVLLTVVPNTLETMHLPMQNLAGICGFYDYYEYTGKKEFLEEVYPYAKNYLSLWSIKQNGLVDCDSQYSVWEWGDSAENVDYDALENAFYYYALSNVCKMADTLGLDADKTEYETQLADLKTAYNKQLWTKNGYKTAKAKTVDERANAIAVISGLADEEKFVAIKDILKTKQDSSVYMEKYILDAMCRMENIEDAQERIKKRYDKMVNGEDACSTLWENWNVKVGTKNHAWAGGPLIIMSKYFAGISPLEPGYETISIKPQLGSLNKITSNVTTVKGDVKLEVNKSDTELDLTLNLPSKTKVAVEKFSEKPVITVNTNTIYEEGNFVENKNAKFDSEDEKYIYFYVEKGQYHFVSK